MVEPAGGRIEGEERERAREGGVVKVQVKLIIKRSARRAGKGDF